MIRQVLGILLSVLLLLTAMSELVVFSAFKLNQSSIAEKWCVNKKRPALKCHGACFAKKIIAEQEAGNAPGDLIPSPDQISKILTFVPIHALSLLPEKLPHIAEVFIYKGLFSQSFLSSVFHPPKS